MIAGIDGYRAKIIPLDATIARFCTLAVSRLFGRSRDMSRASERRTSALTRATALVREVCSIAGHPTLVDDDRGYLLADGVLDAVRDHDNAALFAWLMEGLSYQGVSDAIAYGYMEQHGFIAAAAVARGLKSKTLCPKLESYWQFDGCGYRKTEATCSEPGRFDACPLPRHRLRNGRLNQTAYSLYLFCRDVAEGDLVGWIDRRLAEADDPKSPARGERMAAAVIEPLTYIYGVSDKVLNMSLSSLLLAGDPGRERWQTAGAAMIAIDTLVHNWLHRTGVLKRFGADHLYGLHCYAADGCADIIRTISRIIDVRAFNPSFPRNFPRFVQHAIWRFCSQSGLDQCNGNRINDLDRCDLEDCPLYRRCGRIALHKFKEPLLLN